MAILHHNEQHNQNPSFLLDSLYCDEEKWQDVDELGDLSEQTDVTDSHELNYSNVSLFSLPFLEQDLLWEDQELNSLFSKEKKQQEESHFNLNNVDSDSALSLARREAVEWMLKVNAHYGFTTLTATLAINYLDRFLFSFHFQKEKPWMLQLVAVACLSLAAKVEETQVPVLLDLQVEDTKYLFEAKTIQRMELLVLCTLEWKMHPVTPLSFLDHIIRRLGLKTHLHWEFLRRCENLLLSLLSDSRFVRYLPSVLATATMLHVIDQIKHNDGVDYKNQLLGVLDISKMIGTLCNTEYLSRLIEQKKVDECCNQIVKVLNANNYGDNNPRKRKEEMGGSPSGVMDAVFRSEGSNDSSLYSSPVRLWKKSRVQEQQMRLSSLSQVFVGIVGTSP